MTSVDNQSWVLVHGYVVNDWCQIPILLIVERVVDGSNLDNLTRVLMNSLLINGRLFQENIHYGKLCSLKPRYPTTKAQKINSYTIIVQLSFEYYNYYATIPLEI
jgi:hypothetical protein